MSLLIQTVLTHNLLEIKMSIYYCDYHVTETRDAQRPISDVVHHQCKTRVARNRPCLILVIALSVSFPVFYLFIGITCIATIVAKSPWDTYKNMMKNHSPLNFFIFAQYTYPHSPSKQCCFIYETLVIVAHVKFFHYRMYF